MRWVRPIISIAMAGGIIYGFVTKQITPTDFMAVAGGAIAWWYVSRDKEKATPPTTTTPTTTTPPPTPPVVTPEIKS